MRKLVRFNTSIALNEFSKIDEKNGIIKGVSVITSDREAAGHGMYVDETMIDQVVAQGRDAERGPGLKARFDHPSACDSSMGTAIGRFKNFRKVGGGEYKKGEGGIVGAGIEPAKAVADLHLLDSAAKSPKGNLKDYVLSLAKEDPNIFATSIVFSGAEAVEFSPEDHPDKDPSEPFFYPHARIDVLHACDVVDEGAANDGLFSRPQYWAEQAEQWADEHPELVNQIVEGVFRSYGLDINQFKNFDMSLIDKLHEAINKFEAKFAGEETVEETVAEEVSEEVEDTVEETEDTTEAPVDEAAESTEEESSEEEGEESEASEEDGVDVAHDAAEALEAKDEELSELSTAIVDLKEELTSLKSENAELKAEIESATKTISELSKISIGSEVELGTNETVQDSAPEETKELTDFDKRLAAKLALEERRSGSKK